MSNINNYTSEALKSTPKSPTKNAETPPNDITFYDTLEYSKNYHVINSKKRARYKHKINIEQQFLPMVIPQKTKEGNTYTERQKKWRKNIVTDSELRLSSAKIIKSNNPLKLYRYIFVNELKANLNGMLYYLIPLVINIIFLLLNIFKYNFLVNAGVAAVTLLYIIIFKKLLKSNKGYIFKIFAFIGLLTTIILLGIILKNIPGFIERIYLPFTIKLLFIVFGIYYFGKFYVLFALCYAGDLKADFGNVVQVKAGPPGCGKTSLGAHEAMVMALLKWQKLQYDFYIWNGKEEKILKRNDLNELLEYKEIKESYNFYIMRPCIPCLWSNICVQDKSGRRSFQIELSHMRGVEKLPLYSVVFFDEIGTVLRSEMSKDKGSNYDVSDMFRLGRHFLKWSVIACEQDFNNIYIDCRRVVGCNQLLSSQEWVCRPLFIYSIYNCLKWLVSDSLDKKIKRNKIMSNFLDRLGKYVNSIGFRRYHYRYVGNTQTDNEVTKSDNKSVIDLTVDKVRYVPSTLICRYDDRAYKQLYPSYFDSRIKGKLHDSLCISGINFDYGKQYISSTSLTEDKRNVINEEIEKLKK